MWVREKDITAFQGRNFEEKVNLRLRAIKLDPLILVFMVLLAIAITGCMPIGYYIASFLGDYDYLVVRIALWLALATGVGRVIQNSLINPRISAALSKEIKKPTMHPTPQQLKTRNERTQP
jgi:hypothetical protein